MIGLLLHLFQALRKMNEFRKMNVLCDVKIIGETVEYSAHKAVLASFSKYFEVSIYVKVLNMCGTYILFY